MSFAGRQPCLVDVSEEMTQLSRERFQSNRSITIMIHDLNEGIPGPLMGKTFYVSVSCLTTNFIDLAKRLELYSQVREVLADGNLFINGDTFVGEAPAISEWGFNNWISCIKAQIRDRPGKEKDSDESKRTQADADRRMGNRPGTIWDMQKDLRRAGYRYVDCLWKFQKLGVVEATR